MSRIDVTGALLNVVCRAYRACRACRACRISSVATQMHDCREAPPNNRHMSNTSVPQRRFLR